MATDLAEFLRGAIALSLLFNLPLMPGMAITAAATYGILLFDKNGFRPMEIVIGALVGVIGLGYLVDVAQIETACHTLTPLLGAGAAVIFLISLISSGISSSVVGTMAGQMIMQGFVGFRIPVWLRRLVTMVPAFIVVALGVNATPRSHGRSRQQPGDRCGRHRGDHPDRHAECCLAASDFWRRHEWARCLIAAAIGQKQAVQLFAASALRSQQTSLSQHR